MFVSEQRFEALIAAITANKANRQAIFKDNKTTALAESTLRQAVYGTEEYNRLEQNFGTVFAVEFSPMDKDCYGG